MDLFLAIETALYLVPFPQQETPNSSWTRRGTWVVNDN